MRGITKDGISNQFVFKEFPDPVAMDQQLLIQVKAISLNYGEVHYAQPDGNIIGWDAAGIITHGAAAPGSGSPAAGTRVLTFARSAGWAELRAVGMNELAVLPDSVSFEDAVALPVAGLTALQALRRGGDLSGKHVLITGASGGVGRFAVQIAHQMGANVTALVGRPERGAGLTALGADRVVTDLENLPAPIDHTLDNVGGAVFDSALAHSGPNAKIMVIGSTSGTRGGTQQPKDGQEVISFGMGGDVASDLAYLVGLLAEGKLDPQVGWRGTWAQINEGVAALIGREVLGKVVLTVD